MTMPSPTPGPSQPSPAPTPAPAPAGAAPASPYQVPAAGAENQAASSSAYSFNPNDPWDLGQLANATITEGTTATPVYAMYSGSRTVTGTPTTQQAQGATGGQIMSDFMATYGENRQQFDSLRTALADAGYYGSDTLASVTSRAAGGNDVRAMKNAIQDYYTYSHDPAIISSYSKLGEAPPTFTQWLAGNGANTGASQKQQAQITYTDPAYLAMYAQRAAGAALGRTLTKSELDAFVGQFHSAEAQNQTAAQEGGSKVTSSDARSEAIQYMMQNFGTEESQHASQGYVNALLDLFLPSGSQRPQINVDPTSVSY